MRVRILKSRVLRGGAGVISLLAVLAIAVGADEESNDERWPKLIEAAKGTITIYQPQVDRFEGRKLEARAAVSVKPKGRQEPVFGAVWMEAQVETDRDARTVTVIGVKVTNVRFPEAKPEHEARFKTLVEAEIPKWNLTMSLDQLVTGLKEAEAARQQAENLKHEPPRIIFVKQPAVLIQLDGEPVMRPVEGASLMRVVNCPHLMVFDPGSRAFWLNSGYIWLQAAAVEGPWKEAEAPAGVSALVTEEALKEAGVERPKSTDERPRIIVSTEPAELISTDGEPAYKPIEGNELLTVTNTESDILLDVTSQQHYVVLSGRWYKAATLDGPWSYTTPEQLPESFARIPETSDRAGLRVHITGTQEAEEALLDAQVPQTAAVKRSEAKLEVQYDGSPEFKGIEGTEMEYAVNTGTAVFKAGNAYYSCDQGVWYKAPRPEGPWVLSDEVPKEVQKIPPSNPHYNVKYVYVYESTPSVVYVGYTPAYLGSYTHMGTLVYGTGYYYAPWIGPAYYYPRCSTWGFHVRYNPYTSGWGFGFSYYSGGYGFSFAWGSGWYGGPWYGPRPGWWGPGGYWRGYHHGYWHGYNRGYWQGRVDTARRPPIAVPYRASNPRIHARPATMDVRNRAAAGGNLYERPENRTRGAVAHQPAQRIARATPSKQPANLRNNVLVDREGNVFRRTNRGWEQRTPGDWQRPSTPATMDRPQLGVPKQPETPATRPSVPRPGPGVDKRPSTSTVGSSAPRSFDRQRLDSEWRARERGAARTDSFRRGGTARTGGWATPRPPGRRR